MSNNIAIIDLGSSSFYLRIIRIEGAHYQEVLRHKYKAELLSGIDAKGHLTASKQQEALSYLAEFAQLLQQHQVTAVKIVGTYTLRSITNNKAFLAEAEAVVGFPITLISGEEEARLVYVGATAKQSFTAKTLVIDIGGGSTELIIGQGNTILQSVSLPMGCVSFKNTFFGNEQFTTVQFDQAIKYAMTILQPVVARFKTEGWKNGVGFSGTIQTIHHILQATDQSYHGITPITLDAIRQQLVLTRTLQQLNLPGLRADRASLLAGGLAILLAIFSCFDLKKLTLSTGGVREGLLYEFLQEIRTHATQTS